MRSDPQTAAQASRRDVDLLEGYDRALAVYERFVGATSTAEAPWMIVDGSHGRARNLTIGRTILDALRKRLDAGRTPPPLRTPSAESAAEPSTEPNTRAAGRGLLDSLDLTRTLPKGEYQKRLEQYQAILHGLGQKAFEQGLTSILVFEGWDAAGKGGAIRRIARTLDPRDYRMIAVAAPNDEERARHYLWRFWRHIPPRGRIRLFDRSWYGRVLVERVEGFAAEHEWRRAYKEIRDFEQQLVRHGILLLKFWLHIDRQEQLRRFRQREQTPFKQHKMSEEDYRNRGKWDAYEAAAEEMVRRTGTDAAPWHLIEANDKRYARIKVLRISCEELEKRLA
jgi:polyphosphate kinase 2 (PPK2 family)